jgi:hypothetical protein
LGPIDASAGITQEQARVISFAGRCRLPPKQARAYGASRLLLLIGSRRSPGVDDDARGIAHCGRRARPPLARCAVQYQQRERTAARWSSGKAAVGAGSVERAGGEHEAGRYARFGPAAGVKTRTVQAASGRRLRHGLGFPAVGDDPCHDRLEVSPCGHHRGPLDDGASRGMSSGQSTDQRPNRVVVHACHRSPFRACAPRPRRNQACARGAAPRQQGQIPRSSSRFGGGPQGASPQAASSWSVAATRFRACRWRVEPLG